MVLLHFFVVNILLYSLVRRDHHVDGLVQEIRNSIATALELR